jgi:AraC-like DNA-binding protein
MDPLSEVLALMKPQSYVSGGYEVAPGTAVQFPRRAGVKCYAVMSGQCWLSVEGSGDAVLLQAGECYILPHGLPFCLATDRAATPVDYETLRSVRKWGNEVPSDQQGGCFLAGGHFVLTGPQADLLLGPLPPVVHLQKDADKDAMRSSLARMREEVSEARPGGAIVMQQLAYALLVQALRLYVEDEATGKSGWLYALADEKLSKALRCMHGKPGNNWSLQELAESVGMSRSLFAVKFKDIVGTSPMEYLTRWRMLLACGRLEASGEYLAELASSLGYQSESAFGKAFKRVMGCSPRQYKALGKSNNRDD